MYECNCAANDVLNKFDVPTTLLRVSTSIDNQTGSLFPAFLHDI